MESQIFLMFSRLEVTRLMFDIFLNDMLSKQHKKSNVRE